MPFNVGEQRAKVKIFKSKDAGITLNMRPPTSPLGQQPIRINLYEGLGFLSEFSPTTQMNLQISFSIV